ncbi:MAG: SGNH/GDSL hydrolase family protein [Verrucomicrobia bacterium]|nr:SGNH/GDSL hydrolase family protein [Verrucomicrobiota bacterium]
MGFPNVLLIGDSIAQGYASAVVEALEGVARVEFIGESGGDSQNVVARLGQWLGETAWDVVHVNCGLDDLKFDLEMGIHQVPLERFEENVYTVVMRLLSATRARLVWATITPIVEERHNEAGRDFRRFASDVEAYNEAALRVMREAGVEIDDLHAFVVERGLEASISDDGVHLTPEAYRAVGREVAGFIEPIVRAAR